MIIAPRTQLEKDLGLLEKPDADALTEAGVLELLLRYSTVEAHFDIVARALMALSAYDSARQGLYDMGEVRHSWGPGAACWVPTHGGRARRPGARRRRSALEFRARWQQQLLPRHQRVALTASMAPAWR